MNSRDIIGTLCGLAGGAVGAVLGYFVFRWIAGQGFYALHFKGPGTDLLVGLAGGPAPWPDFREGWEVQKVVDAVLRSARERRWVMVDSMG